MCKLCWKSARLVTQSIVLKKLKSGVSKSEFRNLDVQSINAASHSPYNPHICTPLSSIDHATSNHAPREQTNAKFKKFVKANPMLKGHNLVFVEGDGNCAPRTIAVHIYGSEGLWNQAKAVVADYALKNFWELITLIGITDDEIIKMATDDTWQSEVFFKVAALRFDMDIVVFAFGGEDRVYQALNRAKNRLKVFFCNGHFCPIAKHTALNRYVAWKYMLHYIQIPFGQYPYRSQASFADVPWPRVLFGGWTSWTSVEIQACPEVQALHPQAR